jgi:hypothetical protein
MIVMLPDGHHYIMQVSLVFVFVRTPVSSYCHCHTYTRIHHNVLTYKSYPILSYPTSYLFIIIAAANNHITTAEFLVSAGAKVNHACHYGDKR